MDTASKSYIEVTDEVQAKLAKVFNCTQKFVYMSLTYRKNTELARKIRYVAVAQYGGEPMRHCPECETLFTTELDGKQYMRQSFKNGAVLLWQKGTCNVIVRFREEEKHYECKSMPDFSKLQLYAESL